MYDLRNSRLSRVLGLCQSDVPAIAQYINGAQRRLLFCKEAGNEGWNGTYAEILFYVSRTTPYITLPREIARLEAVNICQQAGEVNNQFLEYLRFGNGRLPKCRDGCGPKLQVYSRNNAVTFVDLTSPPQYITIFPTDPADFGKRVLLQGTDQNDTPISSIDVFNRVNGVFVTLGTPFVTSPLTFNSLSGIQKDTTIGEIQIYQTDPTTGTQVLLLTMQPNETTAWYRRYYFNPLPLNCCSNTTSTTDNIPVTAIAKMEIIPVVSDTDYLLLQNLEAIIEECQSIRYSEMDTPTAKQMAQEKHTQAVRLLIGELGHYNGIDVPALGFFPFGSAKLERVNISMQ
jgi:hypothetical protein